VAKPSGGAAQAQEPVIPTLPAGKPTLADAAKVAQPTAKTTTVAEINAAARDMGMKAADLAKRLRAEGYTIVGQ
jgi:hypothetical protein